jgi:stalled ribosome alternative rescue factor ArfA
LNLVAAKLLRIKKEKKREGKGQGKKGEKKERRAYL